jgi:hypothetical protein
LLCLGPSRAASRRRASAGNDWTPSKPAKIFRENPNCQLTSCCGARGSPQVPLQVLANALGPPLGPRLGRLALLGLARCWPSMHPCALHSATAKSASQLMFGDCCHELMGNGSEASRRSHSQSQQGGAWCAATTVGPDQNTQQYNVVGQKRCKLTTWSEVFYNLSRHRFGMTPMRSSSFTQRFSQEEPKMKSCHPGGG